MSQLNTPRKIETRSVAKSAPSEKTPASKKQSEKRDTSITPPRSTTRSVRLAERKFFTVAEDLQIIEHFKKHEAKESAQQMAQVLSKIIGHSEESIRDRIRRVLSKLRQVDHKLLAEETRVALC